MMKVIISFTSGIIFSIGLVLSGMTNPEKVIGFLDIFGDWDYSLALVMAGAIGVNILFYNIILSRKPIFELFHYLPSKVHVDKRLVVGAVLFGVGSGIMGICPGPGLVNLAFFNMTSITFVLAMVFGIFLFRFTDHIWSKK